jgi:hypothetical protein
MKNYEILSGSFSKNGNFTGYTILGRAGKVFIHKTQMESLGWKEDKDVKYPFYTIANSETYSQLGADGAPVIKDGVPETFQRLTAACVFAAKANLIAARVNASTLDVEVTKEVSATAKAAGLTDEAVAALLEMA